MNILVIGNGFDIAHGLPTEYKDFLRFTDVFLQIKERGRTLGQQVPVNEDEKERQMVNYLVDLFNKSGTDKKVQKIVDEIEELITDNKWLEYFKSINIDQGWIDFEREISQVIQAFDGARNRALSVLRDSGRGIKLTPYEVAM